MSQNCKCLKYVLLYNCFLYTHRHHAMGENNKGDTSISDYWGYKCRDCAVRPLQSIFVGAKEFITIWEKKKVRFAPWCIIYWLIVKVPLHAAGGKRMLWIILVSFLMVPWNFNELKQCYWFTYCLSIIWAAPETGSFIVCCCISSAGFSLRFSALPAN